MTHITLPRATVEQALEALEQSETTVPYEGFGMARRVAERKHQAAIDALRATLAQQTEQERGMAQPSERTNGQQTARRIT